MALGLAVAATVTPSALGQAYGELYHTQGAGLSAMPAYGELYQTHDAGVAPTLPDDRATRPTAALPSELPQHSVDGPRSGPASNLPAFSTGAPRTAPDVVSKPVTAPVVGSGFDWSDAGIGIAVGLGAASLFGTALVASRRRGTLQGS